MNPFSTYRPLKRHWDGSMVENTDNQASTSGGPTRAEASSNAEAEEEDDADDFFDDLESSLMLTSTVDVARKLTAQIDKTEAAEAFKSRAPDVNKGIYALSALGANPIDLVPKYVAEVEANFDLRLLVASMASSMNATFDSTTSNEECRRVQKALHAWEKANKYYTFPAIGDPSNKPGWLGYTNADIRTKLGTSTLWQAPGADEQDVLSNFKRNRLKWTEAMHSAWTGVQEGHTEYFYLCGHIDQRPSSATSDSGYAMGVNATDEASELDDPSKRSNGSGSNTSGGVSTNGNIPPPVAALVTSAGYLRQIWGGGAPGALKAIQRPATARGAASAIAPGEAANKDNKQDTFEEVCVMMGVSKSIVTRLAAFDVAMHVITREGFKVGQQTNSRYNPVSNLGLRENALEGCCVLVQGRRAVAHALDCVGEAMHAFLGNMGGVGLPSTTRTPMELPRIVSKKVFLHSIESRLELGRHILCRADFGQNNGGTDSINGVEAAARVPTSGQSKVSHRVQLVGDILPGDLQALAGVLTALARFHKATIQKNTAADAAASPIHSSLRGGGLPVAPGFLDEDSRRRATLIDKHKKVFLSTSTAGSNSGARGAGAVTGASVNPMLPHLKSAMRIGRSSIASTRLAEARDDPSEERAKVAVSTEDYLFEREQRRVEGTRDDRGNSLHKRVYARYLAWLESIEADNIEDEGQSEDERVESLCAFTIRVASSARLERALCAALASSVPPASTGGDAAYKVLVENGEQELWRGQRRLLELFFYETPSTSLLAAKEDMDEHPERGPPVEVAIEATYSLPPTVELHPSTVLTAAKKKQEILRLGPLKTY